MKHCIQKLLILSVFFLISFLKAEAINPIKINGLIFDNADNLIYMQTNEIEEPQTITKGYLKEPDRIYIDINNAILTTPKKSYDTKHSVFKNIKVSQFTTDPMTVRLVFEYDSKFDLSNFKIFQSKNGIFIKTGKTIVENQKHKTIYSNSKAAERTIYYKGAQFKEAAVLQVSDIITAANAPKNEITKELSVKKTETKKTSSNYYIDSILKTKDGVLVTGIGRLSLIPAFSLSEPDRLIIDIDDTVVNPEIRNKTYAIGELQTQITPDGKQIDKRETIRIGQNTQSIARLVIQGTNAKDYRTIISPDSRNLYITKRSNVITTKMADNNVNLTEAKHVISNGYEVITLAFDDSASLSTFEENSKLYIDIANINMFNDIVLTNLLKFRPDIQTIRLATDKLRFIIPEQGNYLTLKTTPDNDEIKIFSKLQAPKKTEPKKSDISLTPVINVKVEKQPSISNLFTVVIDAGHGGTDVGATRAGIYEKDITLQIAKLVEKNLNKKNIKTYMIRDKDKTVSLQERSNFSNEKKPNVFVSIHVNSSVNDVSYGVETHWWKEDSINYAKYVHTEMQKYIKKWNTTDRGLFKSQFYVINHTEAPAILCEIGFISNEKERNEIIKPKRQEEIADAISEGIYKFLKAAK